MPSTVGAGCPGRNRRDHGSLGPATPVRVPAPRWPGQPYPVQRAGSAGAPGADRVDTDCSDDNLACESLSTIQCQKGQNPNPFMAPGGSPGGSGGSGGAGGKGGNGAGGHSFAYVNGLSSSVEPSKTAAPVFAHGSAGKGAGTPGEGESTSFKEQE